MRAVGIISPDEIKMVDIPIPEMGEYECLVKMHACGFCNCTDTESVLNTHIHKDMPFPHIQGHEGVGEVVKKGAKVVSYDIGDRIVFPEGRIAPESGFYMCGCGHFADYCIVRDCAALTQGGLPLGSVFADWARKFPKQMSYTDAAVITPMRETLSAARNFGIGAGSRVLIIGDGPSGFGLALFSKLEGAELVAVAGHRNDRLMHAKKDAHADIVINTHDEDVFSRFKGNVDIIIDAVGSPDILIRASHTVRTGGKVGLYAGLKKDRRMIDFHEFANDVSLHKLYSPSGDREVHDELMELIAAGKVDPKHFYSHILPMEKFKQAMDMTLDRTAFKVVLDFDLSADAPAIKV